MGLVLKRHKLHVVMLSLRFSISPRVVSICLEGQGEAAFGDFSR